MSPKEKIHLFVNELTRLHEGRLTPTEQLYHEHVHEIGPINAIIAYFEPLYIRDHFGEPVGIIVFVTTLLGQFEVNTYDCTVSDDSQKVNLPVGVANALTEKFEETYLG